MSRWLIVALEEEKEREEIKKLWGTPEGEWIWKNYKEYKESGDWLKDQSNPDHYNDEYAMQDAWNNDPAYSSTKGDRDIAYNNLIDCLIETTNPIFQKFIEDKLGTTKEKAKIYKKMRQKREQGQDVTEELELLNKE